MYSSSFYTNFLVLIKNVQRRVSNFYTCSKLCLRSNSLYTLAKSDPTSTHACHSRMSSVPSFHFHLIILSPVFMGMLNPANSADKSILLFHCLVASTGPMNFNQFYLLQFRNRINATSDQLKQKSISGV